MECDIDHTDTKVGDAFNYMYEMRLYKYYRKPNYHKCLRTNTEHGSDHHLYKRGNLVGIIHLDHKERLNNVNGTAVELYFPDEVYKESRTKDQLCDDVNSAIEVIRHGKLILFFSLDEDFEDMGPTGPEIHEYNLDGTMRRYTEVDLPPDELRDDEYHCYIEVDDGDIKKYKIMFGNRVYRTIYINGSLRHLRTYYYDRLDGPLASISVYKSGRVKSIKEYDDGTLIRKDRWRDEPRNELGVSEPEWDEEEPEIDLTPPHDSTELRRALGSLTFGKYMSTTVYKEI